MKIFIGLGIATFLTTSAFAAKPVKLNMDLLLNGVETHPTSSVAYGETATIIKQGESGKTYEISIVPTQTVMNGNSAVQLQFVVSTLENGKRTQLSSPKTTVALGNEAKISQDSKDGILELTVNPNL